jgi:hypothetical protein
MYRFAQRVSGVERGADGRQSFVLNWTAGAGCDPTQWYIARVEQTAVRVHNRIILSPGPYQLRVVAHDPMRDVAGSVVYDLEVPDFDRLPFSMRVLMSKSGSTVVTARADEQIKRILPAPPNALRTLPQNDELAVFAEVYDDGRAPAQPIEIVTTVQSDAGAMVFEHAEVRESAGAARNAGRVRLHDTNPARDLGARRLHLGREASSLL